MKNSTQLSMDKRARDRRRKAKILAGLMAFAPLLPATAAFVGCENTTNPEPQYEVKEYTLIARGKSFTVKCREDLWAACLTKINAVIDKLEAAVDPDSVWIDMTLSNGLTIEIGQSGNKCEYNGSTVYLRSDWLISDSNSIIKVFSAILRISASPPSGIVLSIAPLKQFNNAKETVRLSLGTLQAPQRQA
jgi:hypothetical protein